jgi:HSP20 family protein
MRDDDPRLRRFGSDVDRLFVEFIRGDWVPRSGTTAFRPGADVYYNPREDAVVVRLELPGIDPDRITLEIEGSTLRVCGSRQEQRPPDAVYHQMEISYGRFERAISLPPEVDITRASADYNSGYLEIRLPVRAKTQTRNIPISPTAQSQGGEDL